MTAELIAKLDKAAYQGPSNSGTTYVTVPPSLLREAAQALSTATEDARIETLRELRAAPADEEIRKLLSLAQIVGGHPNDDDPEGFDAQVGREFVRLRHKLSALSAERDAAVRGLTAIVRDCDMSRQEFVLQGPAFACRQVEHAVGIARAALSTPARGESPMNRKVTITFEAWFDPNDTADQAFLKAARALVLSPADQRIQLRHGALIVGADMIVAQVVEEALTQ